MEDKIKAMITRLRREKNAGYLWNEFRQFIEENLTEVCQSLDTRWLVSVCDTYVDYADGITSRNAMLVVQMVNMEKLWATYLLMYDVDENPKKISALRKNKVIPLWDGMYSFNINHGDMTNNLFARIGGLMKSTPVIEKIYREIVQRMKSHGSVLSQIDRYHRRLFEPYPRRSLVRSLRKRIRIFLRTYKI
jgi:hypothetical protein